MRALALLASAAAGARSVSIQHHDEEPALPAAWHETASVPLPSDQFPFAVALKALRPGAVAAAAKRVSDPADASYGEYLTNAELAALAGNEGAVAAVTEWLAGEGIAYRVAAARDRVFADATVAQAEAALRTAVRRVGSAGGAAALRAGDVRVPAAVAPHVRAIVGPHALPLPRRARLAAPPTEPYAVTPSVIAQAYSVSGVAASGSGDVRQAVAEFQGQYMDAPILDDFLKRFVNGTEEDDRKVAKFVPSYHKGDGTEAMLDIEYIMGVAPKVRTEFWEWPGQAFCTDLLGWTAAILNATEPYPLVHSVSYGWQGNLSRVGCKGNDLDTIDDDFAKIAAKGITIIFASGDSGSGQTQPACPVKGEGTVSGKLLGSFSSIQSSSCCSACNDTCGLWEWQVSRDKSSPLENRTCNIYATGATHEPFKPGPGSKVIISEYGGAAPAAKTELYASWPASSPWVTAVGSTRFIDNKPGSGEMATDQFGSGGGFSAMFEKDHDWQNDAVAAYLKNAPKGSLPPDDSYDKNGRATPDVAGLGEGYQVLLNSPPCAMAEPKVFDGTVISTKDFNDSSEPFEVARLCCEECNKTKGCAAWVLNSTEETLAPTPAPPPGPVKCADIPPEGRGTCGEIMNITKDNCTKSESSGQKCCWDDYNNWCFTAHAHPLPRKYANECMIFGADAKPSTKPVSGGKPGEGGYWHASGAVAQRGAGTIRSVGGTSASAPMFAALISLCNEARHQQGKGALGFLNPFLYQNADAFTDITVGTNKISRGGQPLTAGWDCAKGWDPATGLGTPRFDKLLAAALAA